MEKYNKIKYIDSRELLPIFNNQKSFYKKAILKKYYNKNNVLLKVELYSYNTLVCTIKDGVYTLNNDVKYSLLFSNTTLKHLKDFLKQYHYTIKWNIQTKKDILKYNNISYY